VLEVPTDSKRFAVARELTRINLGPAVPQC
jgi:hypothetical protein